MVIATEKRNVYCEIMHVKNACEMHCNVNIFSIFSIRLLVVVFVEIYSQQDGVLFSFLTNESFSTIIN